MFGMYPPWMMFPGMQQTAQQDNPIKQAKAWIKFLKMQEEIKKTKDKKEEKKKEFSEAQMILILTFVGLFAGPMYDWLMRVLWAHALQLH